MNILCIPWPDALMHETASLVLMCEDNITSSWAESGKAQCGGVASDHILKREPFHDTARSFSH